MSDYRPHTTPTNLGPIESEFDRGFRLGNGQGYEAGLLEGKRTPLDLAETRHFLAGHPDPSNCAECDSWGEAAFLCLKARDDHGRKER